MDFSRWQQLMDGLNILPSIETFQALVHAYSENHRYYHNKKHIEAMLKHLDSVVDLAQYPEELELSIWFHDAIYKTRSSTNEKDSADWAQNFLSGNNCGKPTVDRVFNLIMATRHSSKVETDDEKLLVDLDLTILGSDPQTYHQFESDVRKEYQWVPSSLYRKKRKEILKGFLSKDRIYNSDFFFDTMESQARVNLEAAIHVL